MARRCTGSGESRRDADSEARAVWAKALAKVSNDEELLQMVVAARKGHGRDWLQDLVQISDTALSHDQIAAATIAAFAGIQSQWPQNQTLLDRSGGWIAKALARAIERFQSDQHALAWLERFRRAQSWPEACSSWRFHLEALDLRYRLWDREVFGPCLLPCADSLAERSEDRASGRPDARPATGGCRRRRTVRKRRSVGRRRIGRRGLGWRLPAQRRLVWNHQLGQTACAFVDRAA